MDKGTSYGIIAIIVIGFIIAAFVIIIAQVIKANSDYNKNEKQSSIKREPDQQEPAKPVFEKLPYYLKSTVLTNYEKKLFKILAPVCSKYNLILFSKMRIADFVQPYQQRDYYKWFNRISSKHVDFLICQPETFKPVLAIELDDYTHQYKSRVERDKFVDSVYSSVALPVLHITEVNSEKIEKSVAEILGISVSTIS